MYSYMQAQRDVEISGPSDIVTFKLCSSEVLKACLEVFTLMTGSLNNLLNNIGPGI